jgi:SAM-dependent methyltransferase
VNAGKRIVTAPLRAGCSWGLARFPGVFEPVRRWSWLWQPGASQRWHERFYGTGVDPYHFDTDPYEQQKYARLLDALGARRFRCALELGCAEGVFTEMLASRCAELTAVDISKTALARAAHRLEGCPNVRLEQRTLPFDCPAGPFELIVCADVLYFWPRPTLEFGLARLRGRLVPEGELLLLHYLGDFGQASNGRIVHRLAAEDPDLTHRLGNTYPGVGPGGSGYRLDLFVKQT